MIPMSGEISGQALSLLVTRVSPELAAPCAMSIRLACQSGVHGLASASKAYMLSCTVATKTTLCVPPATDRPATHKGCA
jgi:hypothetical protein